MNNSKDYCSNCNNNMPANAKFCGICGSTIIQADSTSGGASNHHFQPQHQQYQQHQHQQYQHQTQHQQHVRTSFTHQGSFYDTPEVRSMIGDNADYYIRQFNKVSANGSSVSWNWPAFLFNWIWMLYRGMISNPLTWVFLAIQTVLYVLVFVAPSIAFILFIVSIIPHVISGILGNSWYKSQIDERLRRF